MDVSGSFGWFGKYAVFLHSIFLLLFCFCSCFTYRTLCSLDFPWGYLPADWLVPSTNFVDNWKFLDCLSPYIALEMRENSVICMAAWCSGAAGLDWMWNAVGNLVAKIPMDVAYCAESKGAAETLANLDERKWREREKKIYNYY